MNIRIWDCVSPINNIPSEDILKNRKDLKANAGDIFLVNDDYGNTLEIQIGKNIKSIYKLSNELTIEQVAQEYIRIKEQEKQQEEQDRITIEKMDKKIYILEAEQKKQHEEILSNMVATTEIYEMLLTMSASENIDAKFQNLGGNSMVEVYVTLILNGVKTIDQVPTVIREKVREQLELLVK